MGLYRRYVLPRLIHNSMRQAELEPLRAALLEAACGRVLEVGIGSGLNIPFYGREVRQVIGIDPSRALLERARQTAAWSRCPVRLLEGRGETLPLVSHAIDTVVMTWTLCSAADPIGLLGEVRRVLRPDGTLLFIEHGRAPDSQPDVQRWQQRLTPLWRRLAGDCHLDRPVDRLLTAAGLQPTALDCGYMVSGPKCLTFHYRGHAKPRQVETSA